MSNTKEISVRQIGQNMIVTINGEVTTRRMPNKVEREELKTLVKDFNSKPTKKLDKLIESMMSGVIPPAKTSDTSVTKAKKAKVIKEKAAEPVKLDMTLEDVANFLRQNGYNVQERTASTSRGGEY